MRISRRRLSRVHAVYYLLTGLWPLVSYRSFELVTGSKREPWLVKMVGLLAAAIGVALSVDAARPSDAHATGSRQLRDGTARGDEPVRTTLAISSAAAFAAVDVWYTARGTLRPVYLGDALVEAGLIAAWVSAR